MSIEQNKAVAAELVKAISAGDADGIRGHVAPEATWWVMGFPRDRTLSRDQMIHGARAIVDKVLPGGFNMSIIGMTAEGDRVAVEVEGRSHTVEGKLYNNFYHFLFVFREGQVIRAMEYTNPQHAIEVLGDVVKHLGKK
jgi:uncharacterized protein